jgi:5-methylcytosine-specific restriction endonuclease McrA
MANVAVTRFKKGQHYSPTTEFKKGFIPWNKGLVGVQVSTRKGKKGRKHTDEEKIKVGLAQQREKHWNWKGGKPKCSDCGKTLSGYKNKKCCHCKGLRGELSPVWKGGHRSERKKAMGKREYRIWRVAVFTRDNYTCQECGVRGKYMEADHIKPWALYPELRYAIDNGRTLCKPCHMKTETYPKSLLGGVN